MSARQDFKAGLLIVIAGMLGASCGGGGGGGGDDDGGGVAGYRFSQANMTPAAEAGGDIADTFPALSYFTFTMLDALPQGAAGRQAEASVPFPMADLCASGTATMLWDDVDNSSKLSPGDALTLTFNNCDIEGQGGKTNGSAKLTFTAAALPASATAMVNLNIASTEVVDGKTENESITGNMLLQIDSPNGIQYKFSYGGKTRSDAMTNTLNGVTEKFGCFDVEHSFSLATPGSYLLKVRGIANLSGKIMQIGSYFSDLPLTFQPGTGDSSVPTAGTLWFLSFDGRSSAGLSPCSVVGSPGQVNSDNSSMLLTATGGGNVKLDLYPKENQPPTFTINTSWAALTGD